MDFRLVFIETQTQKMALGVQALGLMTWVKNAEACLCYCVTHLKKT